MDIQTFILIFAVSVIVLGSLISAAVCSVLDNCSVDRTDDALSWSVAHDLTSCVQDVSDLVSAWCFDALPRSQC